jgi:hypothetical protein
MSSRLLNGEGICFDASATCSTVPFAKASKGTIATLPSSHRQVLFPDAATASGTGFLMACVQARGATLREATLHQLPTS